jgi:hypothetical protein
MATQQNPLQAQGAIQSFPPDFADSRAPQQQAQQGQSNDPPEDIQIALRELLLDMEMQDEVPRRYEIREILKRRLFFRGEQYWWWNADQGMWMPPTQVPLGDLNDFEQPAFQHVTNIIQATLLGLSSVLSQNNVNSNFSPQKASDPKDVQTAKNASKVTDLIHRNNDWPNLVDQLAYFMGTDGFVGSYSRYVSDGDKFGHDERDVLEPVEVPLGAPTIECGACNYAAEGTTEQLGPICPECGESLHDIPAPTTTVPQKIGTVQIPRGQEVVTFVPALQLKRTMWADEQSEFLYMDWITDLHKSVAMSTYQDKADKIASASGGESDGGTVNTYERIARRLLYLGSGRHTGVMLKDLGTFRRAWIRAKAFWGIPGHHDGEQVPCMRCKLISLYPKGAHVVFFNDVFCEARDESMDEKWETMHTMPGEGQLRETLISAIMPIQEQLNDAINLLFEICMYGVPEGFASEKLLDFEARSKQVASAGNVTPVNLDGQDVRASLMFTPATEPSQGMMKYIDMLLNAIPQMLSGYFPALFGGDTGGNDTAAGISIQRNQAMGRIGRAWRRMQVFLANTDGKAVRAFAKNRTEDVEIPKQTQSGDYDSDMIRLEDVQGNVTAYPEVEAQYPTLQSDIRALMLNLYNGAPANPLTLQWMSIPENLEYVLRVLGATDIEAAGEQQRKKTYKDIEQLVSEPPQQTEAQPPRPPSAQEPQGFPGQQAMFLPSVKPDPDVDDLKVAADTCKTWLISDAGLEAAESNAMGYENVKAYKKACDQLGKMQQLQQLVAAQAMQGEGPLSDLGGGEHIQSPPAHGMPPPQAGPKGPEAPSASPA